MSLFGFVKDIGRRIFNKDEEAEDKIRDHIQEAGVGIRDFEVEYEGNGGHAVLKGEVNTQADKEKAILLAGNIARVAEVFANGLTVTEEEEAEYSKQADATAADAAGSAGSAKPVDGPAGEVTTTEFYVIESGDTLSKIAKRVYGDAMQYTKIFEANREVIADPDKIFVGQKIRIPK